MMRFNYTLPVIVGFFILFFADSTKTDSIFKNLDIDIVNKNDVERPFAIVQLFTSQGCSSCPSADKLLEKVKKKYVNKNVVVMSYHVDYWNRLGWKDPFSKKEYTQLQYKYSAKFNSKSVYTPQAVVNGEVHFVGSSDSKMGTNLSKYLKTSAENGIVIKKIQQDKNKVSVDYEVSGNTSGKKLKLALVIKERKTSIGRGENGGRVLTNINIVIEEIEVDIKIKSGTLTLNIPDLLESKDALSVIGFVQQKNLEITAATQKDI